MNDLQEHAVQSPNDPMFGAIDIVEAFTALRHELKLQVRSGRENLDTLQSSHAAILQNLNQLSELWESNLTTRGAESDDRSRRMANALAEMDESLQRALHSIHNPRSSSPNSVGLLEAFDRLTCSHGNLLTWMAGPLLNRVRRLIQQHLEDCAASEALHQSSQSGLKILSLRLTNLMKGCQILRVDVHGKPFDAETMCAIDVIEHPSTPSSHVAEQIRPAYMWKGQILRFAEVRIAK